MNRLRRHPVRVLACLGFAALLWGVLASAHTSPAQGTVTGWSVLVGGPQTPQTTQTNEILLGSACADAWDCWAVGLSVPPTQQGQPTTQPTVMVEHWNGVNWSIVPNAAPTGTDASLLYGVTCVTRSNCWAVGAENVGSQGPSLALVEHWNGATWSPVPVPTTLGFLFSVACSGPSNCFAVGSIMNINTGEPQHTVIFHWDGSTWQNSPIPSSGQPNDEITSVTSAGSSECWAVGNAGPNPYSGGILIDLFFHVQGAEPWILNWNGSSWSGQPASDPSNPDGALLNGVTCANTTQCWAVGSTMDASGDPLAPLVEQWNGASWGIVPAATIASQAQLNSVTCVSARACWAVGGYGDASIPVPFIERWDGTSWTVDPTPNTIGLGYLAGVACVRGSHCVATGFAGTAFGAGVIEQPLVEQTDEPFFGGQGFDAAGADGGVFTFGDAAFFGSMGGTHLNARIVGTAATPDTKGYWLVGADGGIFSFGDAAFLGSMGGVHLNKPIVGMAPTPDGHGYWEVASDGGVFSFGDASFFGSMGGTHLNSPMVGMAGTPDGGGYWLVAADGGIFAFGDAGYYGSMGGTHLDGPIVGMSSTPDGGGYWLAASDGGVFAFGNAPFFGSVVGQGLTVSAPVSAITVTPDGHGYWLMGSDGAVYFYGDASWLGTLAEVGLSAPITSVSGPT